jgi:hypothetical protein
MREVKFTKDFADKKKGDVFKCDGQLASHLVRVDKVAEFTKADIAGLETAKKEAKKAAADAVILEAKAAAEATEAAEAAEAAEKLNDIN